MRRIVAYLLLLSLLLTACGAPNTCTDPLGCVFIGGDEPITIAVALTLSGPVSPYGIDALRGVELAIADQEKLMNHPIVLLQEDETCTAGGGQEAATRLAANPAVVGVIGATCTSATEQAAKILGEAGMVLISPSSTAASLTAEETHQPGFLRTIHNDKSQAKTVAEFAYLALGARTMAAIQDGSPYSEELQDEACSVFEGLGGKCVARYILTSGTSPKGALDHIMLFKPEVIYFPLYTVDGVAITRMVVSMELENTALISSDGLLNTDFVTQTEGFSEGMYISGPSVAKIDPSFYANYEARYNEKPIAVYAAQAYDATMILFAAIEKVARRTGGGIIIPRQALRNALFATRDYPGLSGILTCTALGDCTTPNVTIYQVRGLDFEPIYP